MIELYIYLESKYPFTFDGQFECLKIWSRL